MAENMNALKPNGELLTIEKFGYGYSDICDAACDIDSLFSVENGCKL